MSQQQIPWYKAVLIHSMTSALCFTIAVLSLQEFILLFGVDGLNGVRGSPEVEDKTRGT